MNTKKLSLILLLLNTLLFFSSHAQPLTYISQWGSFGTEPEQFNNPHGIAIDQSFNVFVVDTENHRVQKFDTDGNFISQWGSNGTGNGQFGYPVGIAIDLNGDIYIADTNNSRIQKFDADGNFITKWGTSGNGNGQFNRAVGISVDSNGDVYVAEDFNNRIQKFDTNGNYISQWGGFGTGNGRFKGPSDIIVDAEDNIYVIDLSNKRVQKFDINGNYLSQWADASWNAAVAIGLVGTGNIYIIESGNHRVQKYDPDGNFITTWGTEGNGIGEFNSPAGIIVNSKGIVYVVDRSNNRIQKFLDQQISDCILDRTVLNGPAFGTYKASSTLTTSGQIGVYGIANFEAGANITLTEGFHAKPGCDFTAHILSCSSNLNPVNQSQKNLKISQFNINLSNLELSLSPNPTLTQTNIRVSLPEKEIISLTVHNLSGKLLQNLASSLELNHGEYYFDFSNNELKNGIYFISLQTTKTRITKKLIIK